MISHAPGGPGISPTWTSSAKDFVGSSLGPSRIWFTLGFGILNEVYYPRVDAPQIRDLGFIIADDQGWWVEVKRLENYKLRTIAPGIPAIEVVHEHERFSLRLRIAPDPDRDVLLIAATLSGDEKLRPYVLLAPRLGTHGDDNVARVAQFGNWRMLTAGQGPFGLALASADEKQRDAFGRMSAGYVGESDGWQDFHHNGRLSWQYSDAGPGNVALIAELPVSSVLALGFGSSVESAATLAASSLIQSFDAVFERHSEMWRSWHANRQARAMHDSGTTGTLAGQFLTSTVVVRAHRDKTYPGAMVASLSVPWGNARDDLGGYHLVWPRDLVQSAMSLLGLGAESEARHTLQYLIATQKDDGSWFQNQWLEGAPYWQGQQLDESAFPVLLAGALAHRDALKGIAVGDMIRRALSFLARTGPSSQQDRWEENPGIGPFTLSVCIAALVTGAAFLEEPAREFALSLADFWNASLESWTTVRNTALAQRLAVDGYYIRIAPPEVVNDPASLLSALEIRNRNANRTIPYDEEVSIDFLQLVRFGLRDAHDPLIRNSIAVVDALLKSDTPHGPVWHRYNGDGYGEHDDGAPFDGTGRGRGWPLLTGERGHYELAAGNDPTPYLRAMAAMTGPAGMIPEQVWDSAPLPQLRLFPGRPSGSAMPLAWAHAEFIKLMISRHIGHPVDRPQAVWERYGGHVPECRQEFWCPHAQITRIRRAADLVIALPQPAFVRWGCDGWQNVQDRKTRDTGLGVHAATVAIPESARNIQFTWRQDNTGQWAGQDFHVAIDDGPPAMQP